MSLNPEQFHPHVDHYRDGGMGGDENHNVVGFVRTENLIPLREWDRRGSNANFNSHDQINAIRSDIRSGRGITNPLEVHYDRKSQWGYLGEGNHRLQAAIEEGVPHVPVRVVRSPYSAPERKKEGVGAHIPMEQPPSVPDHNWREGYMPTDVHPKYLFGERGDRTPLSAGQFKSKQVDDIQGLLGHR